MIQRATFLSISDIARATGGQIHGSASASVYGVSTDTRDELRERLFVALRGDRFDAHDFLEAAVAGGARALLVDAKARLSADRVRLLAERASVIEVADTLVGLGDLARWHRRQAGIPVIGLTGSNGKSTTKEILAALLSEGRRVLFTEGNLNNLIGAPMTILGIERHHEVAIVEMGMNARGEIARMAEVAEPDVGLVTNVGPAHIGMLGSIEEVAAAKGELYRALDVVRGVAVVNADDRRVVDQARQSGVRNLRTFGRAASDVQLVSERPDGEGQHVELRIDGAKFQAFLPFLGAHNALNAAGAIAAATALPEIAPTQAQLVAGLAKSEGLKGRLKVVRAGRVWVVDDCYNANSASMLAAIETISSKARASKARFVALLGEMRELGEYGPEEHARVGRALVDARADLVAAFGPDAQPIAREAAAGGLTAKHESEDVAALYAWLSPQLADGDFVLVKGSRGIRMERFIDRLKEAI